MSRQNHQKNAVGGAFGRKEEQSIVPRKQKETEASISTREYTDFEKRIMTEYEAARQAGCPTSFLPNRQRRI